MIVSTYPKRTNDGCAEKQQMADVKPGFFPLSHKRANAHSLIGRGSSETFQLMQSL